MSAAAEQRTVPLSHVIGLSVAAGLVPLNSTMIAVALPAIADDFSVSTAEVSVLVTLYLVIMLVGQPIAGRLADAIGTRRTVQAALLGLAAFSALAAIATSFPMLLAARGLQAVCATALSPGIQSLLRVTAPAAEHGRVFGIFGSTMGAGAASGPVVGGALVALFDWRGIFVVNIPIALAAIVSVNATRARALPVETASTARPATGPDGPSASGRILNPVFVAGFTARALTTQAQYALLLLTPLVLDQRGWGAGSIGLVLSALTVGTIAAGPPGGRFGDLAGRRRPAIVGIVLAGLATAALAPAGRSVDPVVLTIALALFGVGYGAADPNFTSASLGSVVGDRAGTAAGVFTTSRYVGSIATTLLITAFVSDDAEGAGVVLTISAATIVGAVVAARWLPAVPTSGAGRSAVEPSAQGRPG